MGFCRWDYVGGILKPWDNVVEEIFLNRLKRVDGNKLILSCVLTKGSDPGFEPRRLLVDENKLILSCVLTKGSDPGFEPRRLLKNEIMS